MSDDESQPNPESPLSSPLPSLEDTLRALHQANRLGFQKQIDQAGGPRQWFQSVVPRVLEIVLSSIPRPPSDAELQTLLLLETQAFWTGIETRLGECARCPPEGAACDGVDRDRIKAGRTVELKVLPGPREQQTECERYKDFRMATRLEAHGVAQALSRTKLLGIAADPKDEVILAFNACLEAGVGHSAPRSFQLLIEGATAREYGVAFLRAILQAHGSTEFHSVVADALIREWRDAYTVKDANPIRALTEVPVLVLDGINSNFLHSEKLGLKELQWLYRTRKDQGLCTILTSLCPAKEAFPGVSVLRV